MMVKLFFKKSHIFSLFSSKTKRFNVCFGIVCLMKFALLVLTIDNCVGRVNKATPSDQAKMEIVIDNFHSDSKATFQDSEGYFKDICEWRDVTCDELRHVIAVRWSWKFTSCRTGLINLAFLPETLTQADLSQGNFRGFLETAELPQSLIVFAASNNKFSGTVDFTSLPKEVIEFLIGGNEFSGSISLNALPMKLQNFSFAKNRFHSSVDLSELPEALLSMNASEVHLFGHADTAKFARNMTDINLTKTKLSGDLA